MAEPRYATFWFLLNCTYISGFCLIKQYKLCRKWRKLDDKQKLLETCDFRTHKYSVMIWRGCIQWWCWLLHQLPLAVMSTMLLALLTMRRTWCYAHVHVYTALPAARCLSISVYITWPRCLSVCLYVSCLPVLIKMSSSTWRMSVDWYWAGLICVPIINIRALESVTSCCLQHYNDALPSSSCMFVLYTCKFWPVLILSRQRPQKWFIYLL